MKRDMDLVRKILLHIEANQDGKITLDIPDYPQEEIYSHVALMEEKGLVEATISRAVGSLDRIEVCAVKRLTWEGHDFLDASRNDTLWEKAKDLCGEKTGGLAIDLLKECLLQLGKANLGNG